MRDIKFRCFDKQTKQMSPPFTLFGEFLLIGAVHAWQRECGNDVKDSLEALKDLEVMQYTGLKDKHGKEIYESDVILHERQSRPYSSKAKTAIVKCIVQWMDGKTYGDNIENPSSFNQNPCFIAKPIGDHESTKWGYDWSEFHDCEVIGNIYENPELCQ